MPAHKKAFRSRPVYRGRRTPRHDSPRRTRLRPIRRISVGAAALIIAVLTWAVLARAFAPRSNSTRQTFDAILILGTPADDDGNPTPELLDRITEGVHEYERGVAPRLLVTGGSAHNQFIEAEVMARAAHAQGVPTANILLEPHAHDTIQNACYSAHILKSHNLHSAEVVSSASHLPRAAMIFSKLAGLEWRMHVAPANLTPGYYSTGASVIEIIKTARYLVWSQWANSCSP